MKFKIVKPIEEPKVTKFYTITSVVNGICHIYIGKTTNLIQRWQSEGYRERVAYDHKRPDLVAKQRESHPGKPFDLYYQGEYVGSYSNLRDACDAHGLNSGNLSYVLNGKARQTKGYTGRYKNPD